MSRPLVDQTYLKFRIWLEDVVSIDPFAYAQWLMENVEQLARDMGDDWTQDDVFTWLREQYVSQNRLNIYPSSQEMQS